MRWCAKKLPIYLHFGLRSALVNPRTSNKVLLYFTNPASTRLAKVVLSCLRQVARGLLARRGGLGAGRGGHQEPYPKIRSEVPLALALRATARNRCGPTGCLAACWLVGPADLNSGLATP